MTKSMTFLNYVYKNTRTNTVYVMGADHVEYSEVIKEGGHLQLTPTMLLTAGCALAPEIHHNGECLQKAELLYD